MDWHEYFTYVPETGDLIWKERPREHFATNRAWRTFCGAFANKKAGCSHLRVGGGKRQSDARVISVGINKKHYLAHRVIWEMHNGPIPLGVQIDHIDMNPLNNRLDNLRLATNRQNNQNKGPNKRNTTGFKGVYRRRDIKSERYYSRIQVNERYVCLGSYPSIAEAKEAYERVSKIIHGEFARE